MDPFTEKLLERTRARRENLQKKMAERPNVNNKQMAKRPREPLADTNSLLSEPVADKAPQPSSKPSPSKRLCSGEKLIPAAGEENQEPQTLPVVPMLTDPPTDKKPPVGPSSRHSSLERAVKQLAPQPGHVNNVEPQPEMTPVPSTPKNQAQKVEKITPATPVPDTCKDDEVEVSASRPAGMRSRLHMLAEQRKCWDGTADAVPDCAPLSVQKRQPDVAAAAETSAPSGTPLGRKGRLANLAATIGSWEDDLSHANIPKANAKEKPHVTVPKSVAGNINSSAAQSQSASSSKFTPGINKGVFPSPKKMDTPAAKTTVHTEIPNQVLTFNSSSQKSNSQSTAVPSSPQKSSTPSTSSVPQSPLKSHVLSRGLNYTSSPQKPELCAKPAIVGPSASQKPSTPAGPSVKSSLERFAERCQERTNQCSPAGVSTKTPTVTSVVTPNTRLVQEKLRAAHAANTSTADLTQKQKMERESELAKIRSCFQNGNNMWKNRNEATDTKKNLDVKEKTDKSVEKETPSIEKQDEATTLSSENLDEASTPSNEEVEEATTSSYVPTTCHTLGNLLTASPPALTSSPLRMTRHNEKKAAEESPKKDEEVVTEREMNVDHSITSEVINELFDGVLEQSEEEEEDEEEDALNISSMSLLTPLAETMAAVVKSPEKRMMTSTPASSFIVKSPDNVCPLGRFQRTDTSYLDSTDSFESLDEAHKLPYSVNAYRSIRVKEMERPHVKQVIVRKEDVSNRAEEPRGTVHFNIKQKMKVLTNEINLQQTVIHQASQALNCCTDEEHGKGSQVEAEAERLLLVAMERREALKAELDQLRAGGPGQKKAPAATESAGMLASKGSITLQELRLPLKADFVCSTANKPDGTKHSFFIIIRSGAENTVATPLATTHRGLSGDTLTFPTKFTLSDISSDFGINIEVYCLVQKREICTDKKRKPNKSKTIWRRAHEAHDLCMSAITPKRFLGITQKSGQTPVVASPGGPNAVRTSNFVLVGSHKLTLSSIGKTKFPLEKIKIEGFERELLSDMFHTKVPFLCPLEGHVYLKMQCEVGSKVEEKGFLTMFEDVSGFGAWHRRWCVLSGYCISYWTYPDDERRKSPIGRINLANCTSKKVEPVNREFCARPNTFELITVRPQREDDKETLVSQCRDTMCVTKNWLSADTKDERNLWMRKLNQILVDLRMWQPDTCYRPQ
ncbi:anillin isoform X3 [Cynoglossus semilaevis]|uniref:anillin isoform X3 n=1 Tax=Cynoglossus semilaevis TaxID=244447 RepID=UPI000D62B594|nr:anillin isoform X3 [Cynoglossus semilaevis]